MKKRKYWRQLIMSRRSAKMRKLMLIYYGAKDVAIRDHSGMSKMLMIFYHDVEVNVDCVQLGFLPRNVAKWVAPLSDSGLFWYSGYVYPKEVLVTALEGNTSIIQMILYVSQGPAFSDISRVGQFEHVSSICSLVASIEFRGLQVFGNFKRFYDVSIDSFPIGSVTAQFLATFSEAFGKTSVQFSESEESDPDKTWQRLRNLGMLHDAIPYPNDRVNHSTHVKREVVARSKTQPRKEREIAILC
ncbi:unnamed protein product [Camellia sinensis]